MTESKPRPQNIAQICRNGHIIVRSLKVSPESRKSFCEKCGAATISECQTCGWPIVGEGYAPFAGGPPYQAPKYCEACGKPFPWTEIALTAAKEYTDGLDQLSLAEKAALKATFDDLTTDTAKTPLAANRFKTLVNKLGPVTGDVLKKIIVNVVTEAVKKSFP